MTNLLWLSLLSIVIAGIFYSRRSLVFGSVLTGAVLLLWSQTSTAGTFANILVWSAFIAITVTLNTTALRRRFLSDRVLKVFRKILPKMSETERIALEAGTVWWDGDLFSGKPDWSKLLNTKIPTLTEEEQAFIDGPVNELCDMLDDWKITHTELDLPPEVWAFLKEQGFFGMIIPKKFGGKAFSALAHSAVVMKVSGRSISAAVTVMVPNSLGPAELIMRYGTDEQREHYLPRLATGKDIPCFALTSPDAGSDAASMTDTGVVCHREFDGNKNVLGILLNWNKRYITLGPVATVLGLAFKLRDPDHLIGEKDDWGITCALIPTDTAGVEIGARHYPLNGAFQNGPNSGKDVFIPIDWIIGGQKQAGQGWRMLMECLAAGRSISLPALSTGAGKLTSRATGAYARIRRQFKTPIGRFEGIEEPLARIAATAYTMDATRVLTAGALDLGHSPSVISAIAKYNLTEAMRKCVDDAMDIQGGSGICLGPNNLMARVYQSVPVSITVEGANILTRSLIIFGQGAIRCHPHVFNEMQAANESDQEKASIAFDQAFWGHIGFAISNAVRTLVLGLTHARFTRKPVNDLSGRYFQHLSHFSSAFALTADIAMAVLGGELKRKEKLSGRLADVLSQMYLMSATLKRFHDQGQQSDDVALLQWSCENSLRIMQQSMDKFLTNFPNRPVAWFLRRAIFPYGKHFRGPSDKLGHKVANLLLNPSAARDRLTSGIYIPDTSNTDTTEPLARIEIALQAVIAAEPCEKKLRSALRSGNISVGTREQEIEYGLQSGTIDQEEADIIRRSDAAREKVISVDQFTNDQLHNYQDGLQTKNSKEHEESKAKSSANKPPPTVNTQECA